MPWQSAQVTASVPGAVPCPAHVAQVAGRRTEISLRRAEHGLGELDGDADLGVGPGLRPTSARAAAGHLAEERLEDVA